MDWKKLAGIAPALARALGGPAGAIASAAVEVLSKTLGVDPTDEAALDARLENLTGAERLALEQANHDFAIRMRMQDTEDERIAAGDRANARAREVAAHDSRTPQVIAAMVLGLFGFIVVMMATGHVEGLKDPFVAGILGTVIGHCSSKADVVVNYYFGSSSSSRAKDNTIGDALSKR